MTGRRLAPSMLVMSYELNREALNGRLSTPAPARSNGRSTFPVLIAGAGPAGLTAAIALARAGVECLLVERRRDLSALPRATVISTRSMELLRAWGLEAEVRAGGVDAEMLMWQCDTLAAAAGGEALEVGYPTTEQSALVSPTAPACVPQDHLEPVLLRHLASLPAASVDFGTEVVGVEEDEDGVEVALRDSATGERRMVAARYLIAADGAHSAVRGALGIPMHGPDNLADSVLALFRAPLWDLVGEHRYGIYTVGPAEGFTGVFLPAGRGDRWLYGAPGAEAGAERVIERIRDGAGDASLDPRIERIGTFTFAAQMAERYRRGNVFLVGDAAHRVTPRGGTGMNTALQDGYDLGWKLAWVLDGWEAEDFLDTYEAERRPVAEHNLARSADPAGSLRSPWAELGVDLGGRIPHAWHGRRSTLDLLGPGMTLFTGPEGAPEVASLSGSAPLLVRPLDESSARALGIDGEEGLLVRPDGVPVGADQKESEWRAAAMSTRTM
jgi:putative polyketide hydroxylase